MWKQKKRRRAIVATLGLASIAFLSACEDSLAVPVRLRDQCKNGVFDEEGDLVSLGGQCQDAAAVANIALRAQVDAVAGELLLQCTALIDGMGLASEPSSSIASVDQAVDACRDLEAGFQLPTGVSCVLVGNTLFCDDPNGVAADLVTLLQLRVPKILDACDELDGRVRSLFFVTRGFDCDGGASDINEACVRAHGVFLETTAIRMSTLTVLCTQLDSSFQEG